MRTSLTALAFVAVLAVPALAIAQPDSKQPAPSAAPTDEALARFKRGLELYEEQDFTGALVEFRRAYEISPNYKVLYNIGQVCFQLTDYACALKNFERYLAEGGNNIASDRRAQVQRDLEKLQTRVARIEIVTNVPGVDITVDDVPVGKTPLKESVVVSSGKRRVFATKEGRVAVTRIVDVGGTDSVRVQLDLVDAATGSSQPAQAYVTPSKWTTLSYVGLGVAGAFGVTAAVTGIFALNASNDLEQKRFSGDEPDSATRSKQTDVRTLSIVSDVFLGAAIVTLGTTLVLTLLRNPKPEPVKTGSIGLRTATSGGTIGLGGRF
jgi:PEGA domain-containing protein